MNKYRNSKVKCGDITFDSKLEYNVYLKLLELKLPFERQVKYVLIPKFEIDGKKIREMTYSSDFNVIINGNEYVIDCKGMETDRFVVKKKMFMYKYRKEIILIKSLKGLNEWLKEVKWDI